MTALPLNTLSATDANQAAAIVKDAHSRRDSTLVITLLSTVQSMDGNKTARAEVAGRALHRAYTLASQGQVSQLRDVLQSTGKKACERGMRQAIQEIGFGVNAKGEADGKGLSIMARKEAERSAMTLEEYIDDTVNRAMAIFCAVACVELSPEAKAEKEAKAAAKKAEREAAKAAKQAEAKPEQVTLSLSDMVQAVIGAMSTGLLSADDMTALDAAFAAATSSNGHYTDTSADVVEVVATEVKARKPRKAKVPTPVLSDSRELAVMH